MVSSQLRLPVMGVVLVAGAGSVNAASLLYAGASSPIVEAVVIIGALTILVVGGIGFTVMAHRRKQRSTIARRLDFH